MRLAAAGQPKRHLPYLGNSRWAGSFSRRFRWFRHPLKVDLMLGSIGLMSGEDGPFWDILSTADMLVWDRSVSRQLASAAAPPGG
jgi:hypothetical protein